MVNGLKRNLRSISKDDLVSNIQLTYAATTALVLQADSDRGEVNNRDTLEMPESAIFASASAESMSATA